MICIKVHTNLTRSSPTAEKQRVSYTWLPGLVSWPSDDHTWQFNAQNTTESQRLCYFWHSNALIPKMLAENGFWHEITSQGHSRSFTLQSFVRVAYRHIILLAVYPTFSKAYSQLNRRIQPSSTTPLSFDAPAKRNPREYPHKPYISRN